MSEMGSSATEAGEAIRPRTSASPESGHSVMITRSNDGIRKKLAAGLTSAPASSAYCIFFTSGHLDSDNG
jgi:hypothetical protein